MDIYEAISRRHTIRDFDDREIPLSVLHKLVEAGLQAPSNDHLRKWEFVILQDKALRETLVHATQIPRTHTQATSEVDGWGLIDGSQREMYIDAIPKQLSMIIHAGAVILPCFYTGDPILSPATLSSLNCLASIWCCIENILLAAAAEGIFGVTRIPFEDEQAVLKGMLDIPEGYEIPCLLALGYPAAGARRMKQVQIRTDEKIHMNGW